jgi:hypothetical protein
MARKKKASGSESPTGEGTAQGELIYESNPKHGEPWQSGKKGSVCEADVRPRAAQLLRGSHLWGDKRYAVHEGRAYCAQEHRPNRWHGYPIGWRDVPAKLRTKWVKDGRVKKRQIDRFWK